MTESEAIRIVYYGIYPEEKGKLYLYDKHRVARSYVEMLVALGVLKLEDDLEARLAQHISHHMSHVDRNTISPKQLSDILKELNLTLEQEL